MLHRLACVALLALAVGVVAAQPPGPPVVGRPADPALNPVPTDSFFFVSAKVSKLWDLPAAKPLREWAAAQKPGPFDQLVGLPPAEIDRVTLFAASADRDGGSPVLLVTTRQQYNEARVLKALGVGERGERPRRAGRAVEVGGAFRWVVFVDDRTLLLLSKDADDTSGGPNLLAQLIARKPDGPLAAALVAAQQHDFTAGLDVRGLAGLLGGEEGIDRQFVPYLALLTARSATLTADFDKTARVQLTLVFPDAAAARRAAPVLDEGMKAVAEVLTRDGPRSDPVERAMTGWALGVLKAATVTTAGNNVTATAEVPYQDELAKFVAVLPKELAVFRNESVALNNLKQIGLGLHSLHDVNGSFPGDVGFGPKPPAWSWRVQVLPFIEQENIFKLLDFNKPWDDPANLKVLEAAEMPKVFEVPGRPAPKGHTYFRVFTLPKDAKGFERPFFKEGERGPKVTQVTDGLSNTFMVVEAGEAVPWYKPDVLAYDGKLPLPPLGDKDRDRVLVLMGDGSVQSLRPSRLGEKTLRAMITINGGEVVPPAK